jgi:hypothetical protein
VLDAYPHFVFCPFCFIRFTRARESDAIPALYIYDTLLVLSEEITGKKLLFEKGIFSFLRIKTWSPVFDLRNRGHQGRAAPILSSPLE